MFRRSRVVIARKTTHLAKRLAQPLSKRKLLHAARVIGPTLVALTFAGVAHAQGTMDFSGAQTLMGTFNWRNDYVAVEQWSRNIVRDRYVHLNQLHEEHQRFAVTWDINLRLQGFAEAFDPHKHIRG